MRTLTSLLILLSLCGLGYKAEATHLVGGSMSYKYSHTLSNGNLVYTVRLDIYRDASNPDNADFDASIQVGIYNNNANLSLLRIKVIKLKTRYDVNPIRNTTCPNSLSYRVEYGLYEDTISVPPSTVGYHLTFARCCRNKQTNLPNDANNAAFQGQTYYCKIPPTNIKNSSPFFSQLPIPLICAGDTTNLLITATDPDKDSLVYSFVTPFQGGSSSPNGAIPTPPSTLSLPLPNVVYNSGYSGSRPFGSSDYTNIVSSNGLTTMYAPAAGQYAVAIRVNEYRSGVLISSVYLDLQFFVIECPPNRKPYASPAGGGFYREVDAGQQICFNILTYDQDGSDSVFFEAFGDIFTGSNGFDPPLATMTNNDGHSGVANTFCWTPSCEQASEKPYVFAITVRDNGCLPKSETYNFAIKVRKFEGPTTLTGPKSICQNTTGTYKLTGTSANSTITWSVKKGVILSGQGGTQLTVRWDTAGAGEVNVIEVNNKGCKSDLIKYDVQVSPAPVKPEFSGDSAVCQYTFHTYTVTNAAAGHEYRWFVEGGTIQVNNGQSIGVRWGSQGTGKVQVLSKSLSGILCESDTITLPVKIIFPEVTNFAGPSSVCPFVRGVEYTLDSIGGSIYIWTIINGTKTSGGNSHKITVNWGTEGTGQIKVFQINKLGCSSDTFYFNVKIGYILEGMDPIGDMELCEYSSLVPYYVYNTNGSTYAWYVTGGTIVSGQGTNKILVDWDSYTNSPGTISVTETAFDSVNMKPCIGKTHKINVKLNPLPTADKIEGKMEVCQLTGNYDYKVKGFGGSTYTWLITPAMAFSGQGTSTITVNWDKPGSYKIIVAEMSKDSCPGNAIDTIVIVRPKPQTSPIRGDTIVCYPFYENNPYAVHGYDKSTYEWTMTGGTPVESSNDSQVLVNWNGLRYSNISVVETSQHGCVGDPVTLGVITDNPKLSMRFVSVGYPDDRMEIAWNLADGELYNSKFTIEKRKTGSNDWNKVRTVSKDTFYWLEKPLNTDNHSWDYRVLGNNLCFNPIVSDIHTNINLKGKQEPKYVVNMTFSNYRGWIDGVKNYELYRNLPGKTPYTLYHPFANDSSVVFGNGFDNFTQCYRVKAYQQGTSEISWSNEICFDFEPIIWVPNAFTPNEDLANPVFKVVTASLKTYQIQIYDRWGEKIFISNNPDISWDGTYRGVNCAEGVYMYIIQYSGFDNRVKQLKGDITLIR